MEPAAATVVTTTVRPVLSGRYAKYAKMANRRNRRARSDKEAGTDRKISTITGHFLELECVLQNADLNTLTTDSLQSTLERLKVQNAKLSSEERPVPEVAKTFDGIQITSFTDQEDFEIFCKFNVMENLELLLERRAAVWENVPLSVADPSVLYYEHSANEERFPNEQSTENDNLNNNFSSNQHQTVRIQRRKRKRWTQAQVAVPFTEQFTYSMDFLDADHFGEKMYVDKEEYFDDKAYISQPSDFKVRNQSRRVSAASTSTEVNGIVNNNNKRPLQQKNNSSPNLAKTFKKSSFYMTPNKSRRIKRATTELNAEGLVIKTEDENEEKKELGESYSDVDNEHDKVLKVLEQRLLVKDNQDQATKHHPTPSRWKTMPNASSLVLNPAPTYTFDVMGNQHPSTSSKKINLVDRKEAATPTMADRMCFKGPVPSIFFFEKGRPNYESNLKHYMSFQDKLYKTVLENRRKYGESVERTRLHSLVGKPDQRVLKLLQRRLLLQNRKGANLTTDHHHHQLQQMRQQQLYHQHLGQQQQQPQPLSIQQGCSQLQPNFQGHQQQWRQAMVNDGQKVMTANGSRPTFQRQPFQRFAAASEAVHQIQGQNMAQYYNAHNRQVFIRAPGTLQTATTMTTATTSNDATSRVFNSGTMPVQHLTQQGPQQGPYVCSQTSNAPITQSSSPGSTSIYAYAPNTLVPVAKTPTQKFFTQNRSTAGGRVLLNPVNIIRKQQQQQSQRVQLTSTSASRPIYVINPQSGGSAGSFPLKSTTTNLVTNIAPNGPMGANTSTVAGTLLTPKFVNIMPRPTILATGTPSTSGGGVPVTASPVSRKITVQIVKTPDVWSSGVANVNANVAATNTPAVSDSNIFGTFNLKYDSQSTFDPGHETSRRILFPSTPSADEQHQCSTETTAATATIHSSGANSSNY